MSGSERSDGGADVVWHQQDRLWALRCNGHCAAFRADHRHDQVRSWPRTCASEQIGSLAMAEIAWSDGDERV
eukprot:1310551-Rhodomonas_salina.2